jgi:hypothetical protein
MSNNKQQMAVEWLVSQLQKTKDWQRVINEANQSTTSVRNVIQQAKEMHRQEIINAVDGFPLSNRGLNGTDYYEQTYGGNK